VESLRSKTNATCKREQLFTAASAAHLPESN
jgi:hypothetical protein